MPKVNKTNVSRKALKKDAIRVLSRSASAFARCSVHDVPELAAKVLADLESLAERLDAIE